MRSSGSTPSLPPRAPIRLLILLAGEDHPKACTGRRLVRGGRARSLPRIGPNGGRPVVLDPHARSPLSRGDLAAARRDGLLAVDCSWNRIAQRGSLPEPLPGADGRGIRRRLPLLIAGNPQHYGRLGELNTAEALAAALYVLDRPSEAKALLVGIPGASSFFEVNAERLERYRSASTPEEILAAERALFGPPSA
jgi:pre-rRNA-processing protein TSR3